EVLLSRINEIFLRACADYLQISTPIVHSCAVPGHADPTCRLLQICQHFDAEKYLSGPAAKSYLDVEAFELAKVQIEWMSYSTYPATPSNPENYPASIVDALFWLPSDRIFK
ncbi:MAG: WbqC family protein, partial [Pseudomonadota bacterium]